MLCEQILFKENEKINTAWATGSLPTQLGCIIVNGCNMAVLEYKKKEQEFTFQKTTTINNATLENLFEKRNKGIVLSPYLEKNILPKQDSVHVATLIKQNKVVVQFFWNGLLQNKDDIHLGDAEAPKISMKEFIKAIEDFCGQHPNNFVAEIINTSNREAFFVRKEIKSKYPNCIIKTGGGELLKNYHITFTPAIRISKPNEKPEVKTSYGIETLQYDLKHALL